MEENNASGGATAPTGTPAPTTTPPAAQATPPVVQPQGLTVAEVQALMDQKFAAFGETLKGSIQEIVAGRKEKPEPAPQGQQSQVLTVPSLQDDPAYKALLTKQEAQEAKHAEMERRLAHEQTLRESAESKALEQERFQSVFGALTDLDNPSRTDADGGQIAAKYLLSQQKIARSQNGAYFVETRDPTTGEAKTVPVKDFVQGWLQTKEGQRFRPALPSGSGLTSSYLNPAGAPAPSQHMTPVERLGQARQKDRATRGLTNN